MSSTMTDYRNEDGVYFACAECGHTHFNACARKYAMPCGNVSGVSECNCRGQERTTVRSVVNQWAKDHIVGDVTPMAFLTEDNREDLIRRLERLNLDPHSP